MMRPLFLSSLAALLLAACGAPEAETTVNEADREDAAPAASGEAAESEADFRLTGAWVRTPPGGRDVTAGYLLIEGPAGVSVVSASSPEVDRIELHTHVHEDGVMRMRAVERFTLENGRVELRPGGDHLMLYGLSEAVSEGGAINIALTFDSGLETNIIFPVRASAPMTGEGG